MYTHRFQLTLLLSLCFACWGLPSSVQAQSLAFSSDLPIVLIETGGEVIPDEPRIVVEMAIINNGYGKRNYLTDVPNDFNGNVAIEIRGSTSQSFPKKQYALETQTTNGNNWNVSLMGLPEENDWILSAPYTDKTLMRNVLAFYLSQQLGHYAPRTRFCELFLNGEYMGVYVLTEKIKRDNNRVNIENMPEEDTGSDDQTGGYIVKIDKTTSSSCSGWSTHIGGVYFQYEYPKCDDIIPVQKQYIQQYINDFEEALFSEEFADHKIGYRPYVDLNSLIDFFIINEIAKNIDAYRLSTFLHKQNIREGGKLCYGPVWDLNLGFGNADYLDGYPVGGFIATRDVWWDRILQDTIFFDSLTWRWSELRKSKLSNASIKATVDSLADILGEAQQRNFEKWDILQSYIWPNPYVGNTYSNEIEHLKSWLTKRLNWMDTELLRVDQSDLNNFTMNLFPNPFSNYLTIEFDLTEASSVAVKVLNIDGLQVAQFLPKTNYEAGRHRIIWDNFNHNLQLYENFYFVALEVNGRIESVKKVLHVKR